MELNLEKKVVLITASGQGLGKGIAEAFLEEKSNVILTDILEDRLINTVNELADKYGPERVFSYKGDFTDVNTIQDCVLKSIEHFGKIDILVANLGTGSSVPSWNPDEEEWVRMFKLNFDAARYITNEIVPQMIKAGGGGVIYISSIAGKEIIGAPISYTVAKSSLISYAKNLSFKLADENIRINTVCPGNIFFENGTWDRKMKENAEGVEKMLRNSVPLRRFASPKEIADFVVFISSDRASFMTGSCLIIDGGQTVCVA